MSGIRYDAPVFGRGFTGTAPDFAARRRRMRILSGSLALVVIIGTLAVMTLRPLLTYYNGTPTTAHVDNCVTEYHHGRHGSQRRTTCYGTWTLNGVRHSGEIEGAGESDEGEDIRVRATADSAVTEDTPLTAAITGVVVLVAGAFAFVIVVVVAPNRIGRFPARRSPYGPGGYQPGPYGPGPYQQNPYGPGPYQQGGYGQGTYGQAVNGQGPYQPGPYQPGPPQQEPPQQGPWG